MNIFISSDLDQKKWRQLKIKNLHITISKRKIHNEKTDHLGNSYAVCKNAVRLHIFCNGLLTLSILERLPTFSIGKALGLKG